jgi:NitT/TauT family transport system substrate-binding protein
VNTPATPSGPGLTGLGKFITFVLVAGLIGLGIFVVTKRGETRRPASSASQDGAQSAGAGGSVAGRSAAPQAAKFNADEVVDTMAEVPKLDAPGPYQPKGDTIEIELSEYAGYAGLIAANGGLEPSENSVFFKDHGFKVKLTLSEESSWSALNSGKMAATATTVDVLAVYGKQLNAVVPAQISFSRGADGVVVRSDVKRINALKGQVLSAEQFTETDFFIRYLAQEAGLGVTMLDGRTGKPDPAKVNLVYSKDAFAAGDLFLADLKAGTNRLAGCVTWAPKTTDVVNASEGKAHLLTTNKNLLIVADILIVNKGFAQAQPKTVAGLVDGLLKGNRMVRENPDAYLDVLVKSFNSVKDPNKTEELWDRNSAKEELAKVHLSNLPENLAFFSGAIDAAGSYGGIYNSAVYAYGKELIPTPTPAERFLDLSHLQELEKSGAFKDQVVAIAPIRTEGRTQAVEDNPLLSKDIRFYFRPNSSDLDLNDPQNQSNLDSIKELLRVSPGSTIVLRGHVDNGRVEEFRRSGGDALVRTMALKADQLSKDRANEVQRRLTEKFPQVDKKRLEPVGVGWNEPVSQKSEEDMRVEVQWFLVE